MSNQRGADMLFHGKDLINKRTVDFICRCCIWMFKGILLGSSQ